MSNNSTPTEYILQSQWRGTPSLVLTVSGKLKQERVDGPDFDVHWLTSDTLGGSLGIYVGHHPHFQPPATSTATTKLVGKLPVEFFITPVQDGQKGGAIVEDFFKGCPGGGIDWLRLHIMINAAKPEFLEIVWQGLKTLHLGKIAENKTEKDLPNKESIKRN